MRKRFQIFLKRRSIYLLLIFAVITALYQFCPKYLNPRDLHKEITTGVFHVPWCTLPKLELWPEELKSQFTKHKPLHCSEENWVYIENGTFQFSLSALDKHGKFDCEAVSLVREGDYNVVNGVKIKPLKSGQLLVSDFYEVHCDNHLGTVFNTVLSGIAPKRDFIERMPMKNSERLNILMLGFDSISRMSWMRLLPQSYTYFTDKLGGTVLNGYNIVGDGTPQALLPILTGKNETQLPEARRGHPGAKPVDNHPWVWKELKRLGYITQYGEDAPDMAAFTYRMLGFDKQPTDHYMRPFYIHAEKHYKKHDEPFCFGSLPRHIIMLNWILEMYKVYPTYPKFSFLFHSELSHGDFSKLSIIDLDLKLFLEELFEGEYLKNTVMILMSDHGARFQNIRTTTQGKYEERMPFFAFRFPTWFKEKYQYAMSNFKSNIHKLTTPYDIHETLRNIIHINEPSVDRNSTGISLLKEIPFDRTCTEAGIDAHWCACTRWKKIKPTNFYVQSAASSLVVHINGILGAHLKTCSEVRLNKILSSQVYIPNESLLKFIKSKDTDGRIPEFESSYVIKEKLYQITILTLPGLAKFEATVKFNIQTNTSVVSNNEISRINKYGDQPKCIQDQYPHLRQYCYCKT